jgi:S-adenosylmethionine hydrolase
MDGCYENKYSIYGRGIMMRKLLILTTMMMMMSISALSAGAAVEPSGDGVENLVVLLTDYGTTDFYVGALEDSIYSANPEARISTITHEVPAFNIAEGSYILAQAAREYPPG